MTRYMKVESVQNIFQRTTLTTEEHNDILSTLTFSDNCPVHGVHLRLKYEDLYLHNYSDATALRDGMTKYFEFIITGGTTKH